MSGCLKPFCGGDDTYVHRRVADVLVVRRGRATIMSFLLSSVAICVVGMRQHAGIG
jgi:hypothetical protein